MAAKSLHKLHPSPLTIRKLFNSQLHKNKIPISIWPQNVQSTPSNNSNFNSDPPIVSTLVSFINSPPQLSQTLSQFFVLGFHHDNFIAGHFVKHLSNYLSPQISASLFSLLPNPDAFICNTIIKSFISKSQFDEAFEFYRDSIVGSSICLNNFSYPLIAKLFANLGLVQNGILTHTQILKLGFENDLYVRNAIIHMYSCFGDVNSAWKLFENYEEDSDLVTWNSMIDGLVKNGMVKAARELFDEMSNRDLFSWNVMISGYATKGDMDNAKELFLNMQERDTVTWNSMIDGYAKVGNVSSARDYFDSMPKKNLVSWNIILSLYTRVKEYKECLRLFDETMENDGFKPNEAIFVSVLTSCAYLGDLEKGKQVHSLMRSIDEPDVLLSTSLLTMYTKCGAMDTAKEIFDHIKYKNAVTWNSMIMGYGINGFGHKAIELFFKMESSGVKPNENTFICVLSACAHRGLVVEGYWFFERMVRVYNIEPKVDHIGCMIDMLGRVALAKESEKIVKGVSCESSKALWGALMSASKDCYDSNIGEVLGNKMVEMDPEDEGAYVFLSNVYASRGRWDEVEKVRHMMKEKGVKKDVGVSLVCDSGVKVGQENERSSCKKLVVYSLLSELGGHMKSPNPHIR